MTSVLDRLLAQLREAGGPVSFDELSSRLGVERSAVEPMLDLLVRKRLLTEWNQADHRVACSNGACGTACSGIRGCPFMEFGLPRTLEIRSD